MISKWLVNSTELVTGYIECECCCINHLVRFLTFEGDDSVYVDVKLNPKLGFFNRLWLAIKYILGIDTGRLGEYECSIIAKKEIPRVIEILHAMEK